MITIGIVPSAGHMERRIIERSILMGAWSGAYGMVMS